MSKFKGRDGITIGDLVVKHKGDQLKFKIYDSDSSEGFAEYLSVSDATQLRDYLSSVIPEALDSVTGNE